MKTKRVEVNNKISNQNNSISPIDDTDLLVLNMLDHIDLYNVCNTQKKLYHICIENENLNHKYFLVSVAQKLNIYLDSLIPSKHFYFDHTNLKKIHHKTYSLIKPWGQYTLQETFLYGNFLIATIYPKGELYTNWEDWRALTFESDFPSNKILEIILNILSYSSYYYFDKEHKFNNIYELNDFLNKT